MVPGSRRRSGGQWPGLLSARIALSVLASPPSPSLPSGVTGASERQDLHGLGVELGESSKLVHYGEPKKTALDAVRYGSPIRDTESAAISSINRAGRVLRSSSTPNRHLEDPCNMRRSALASSSPVARILRDSRC